MSEEESSSSVGTTIVAWISIVVIAFGGVSLAVGFFTEMLPQSRAEKRDIERKQVRQEERAALAEEWEELRKEEADRARSLGIPDSAQGIAGLELPNVYFEKADASIQGLIGGGKFTCSNRDPRYRIQINGLDLKQINGGKDVSFKVFETVAEEWTSLFNNPKGGTGPLGTTYDYNGASRFLPNGAESGEKHRYTYHERGGKGSIYLYVFHDSERIWQILFKGADDVVKDLAEAFMARVKVL